MRRIRFVAAGLLVLGGLLQILELVAPGAQADAIIMALFGVMYLVIAVFLFRDNRLFYTIGVVVPLAGLLYAIATLILNPGSQTVFYIAADLVAAACCGYLLYRYRL